MINESDLKSAIPYLRYETLNMMKDHIDTDDYDNYNLHYNVLFDFKYFNPIFGIKQHVHCLRFFKIKYSEDLDELLIILLKKHIIRGENIYSAPFSWLDKFKNVFISNLEDAIEQDDKFCEWIIDNKNYLFHIVKNPSIEITKKALDKHISLLSINNQNDEICCYAINKNPSEIQWVKNKTYDICKYAFDKDRKIIKYVSDLDIREQLLKGLDKDELLNILMHII